MRCRSGHLLHHVENPLVARQAKLRWALLLACRGGVSRVSGAEVCHVFRCATDPRMEGTLSVLTGNLLSMLGASRMGGFGQANHASRAHRQRKRSRLL